MSYPKFPDLRGLVSKLERYAELKHEYRAKGIEPMLAGAEKALTAALKKLRALPNDRALAAREPNALAAIRALRPAGPRRMWAQFDRAKYQDRLAGAFLGRMAGCTLGAPVEGWSVEKMEWFAKECGDAFPPEDYWSETLSPRGKRYQVSPCSAYTRGGLNGVPVDDDIVYTLLGLLIVEDHGPDFTVKDVATAWLKYLPYACTAEDVALINLKKKVPAELAGETENPFCEWIGADIRSDPWGYLAPGCPELAARMAHQDAYLSHRRNGIYGEMYFSAVISAAFDLDDPVKALEVGLTEIPRVCSMAKAVRWALKQAPKVQDYKQARALVDKQFKGMHHVHTLNNACLTIWGLTIGGRDFTKVISQTVAMGLDNDCTGATAGSICGAIVGRQGIPEHWTRNFSNTVRSYLIGQPEFQIDNLLARFERAAETATAGNRR